MKDVEYFYFMLPPSIWKKKPHRSSFKMDAEYAAKAYPGATPILDTREVRRLPSTPEEIASAGRTNGYGLNTRAMTEDEIGRHIQEFDRRLREEGKQP